MSYKSHREREARSGSAKKGKGVFQGRFHSPEEASPPEPFSSEDSDSDQSQSFSGRGAFLQGTFGG